MKVALIQMKVKSGDVEENRSRGLKMTEEAAGCADVVVLPEIWTTGFGLSNIANKAEEETGLTISRIIDIARQFSVSIIAGSLPIKRGGKIYNCSIVVDSSGKVVAKYAKMHLFSSMGETRFFTPGDNRGVFSLNDSKAGIAICYELRFPELFRSLAADGVKIVFLPAAWPDTRLEHWLVLNRARAIENQVYMCAVNCIGTHHETKFSGHSMIVGPTGESVVQGDSNEGILYGNVDFSLVDQSRNNMRLWQDRRPEVYL